MTEIPVTSPTSFQTSNGTADTHVYNPTQNDPKSKEGTFNSSPPASLKPGGRRRREDAPPSSSSSRKDDPLNKMGLFYSKILTYSTGTRYSIYIIPVALILAIPVIVGATQVSVSNPKIGGIRVVWFFTWFEVVWLSFWGMKFVARLLPAVFSFFAGVVSSETKKYARVLQNLEDMITIFGWVVISFVLYEVLFSTASAGNTPKGWTTKFKQVLAAILVSTIIFFVEKILVQLISVSYHARSFNTRIDASKRAVHLLGILFEASRSLFPMYQGEFLDEDYMIHANIEAFVRKGRKDRISEEIKHNGGSRRIFKGIGRVGNKVNSVFGNIAKELTGKRVLPPRAAESIVLECLERTKASKALAQRLWFSFVVEGSDCLHLEDVQEVLGPEDQDLAEDCFDMLDPDGNGDVSLDETTMKLAELCMERKAIARSMHDVSQAIKALDNVLSSVALLISVFALVCFLDTGFHAILTTASTTLLSLSFVFSVTAQEFLGSCIFLFVKHPYDIGDRVHISGPDGINQMEVEEMSLLYTVFRRITDLELIQIPNITLNSLWINNISRSRGLMERIELFISFDTSISDIEALRQEMENFVTASENVRDFQPEIVLRCVGLGSMDKLQLQLEVRHKSNWAIEAIRATRHSKLMCALVLAMRKVPILGPGGGGAPLGDPSNPAYSVAVSDEIAVAAREKAAKDADAARLHPLSQTSASDVPKSHDEGETLATIPESLASDALNAMDLGEALTKDQEPRNISEGILVGSQSLHRATTVGSEASGVSPDLHKTKSPQGRRKAGHAAPSIASVSRQGTGLESVASRTQTGNFDHEAQVVR
ncbi:hypothetical protein VTL71DRAFT_2884 [Oculimacula yallundae]|uniref:Mechanosensitive ion channel protein n=1 Tax=Oculimacula yallundae TaxID=86028 RepID=A0ABR4C6B1_9HELO